MTQPMRFALIGCGRIVKKHIDALMQISEAKLVALCDRDENAVKPWGEKLKIPYYLDYNEMFAKEQIDVVNILTDSGTHAAIVTDIAKYRKHIIVEKPMALKLSDADRMIEACSQHGVRLFVVKQNRYNKAIQKTRQALDTGRFGKLTLGTVRVRWTRTQEYYDQAAWRGTWWGDGGVLTNQASHHIDLLEWFFGEVESVMCMTKTQLVNIETEDTAVAILHFANGALGAIEATTAIRPKDLEASISIFGEKGSVIVGGFSVNQITTWNFTEEKPEDKTVIEEFKELPDNIYGYGHVEYMREVIQAIRNNTKALVDGFEGRKSLELINALYESAETGQVVHLKYRQRHSKLGRER
jgi:UDP-N-acetyl-2-amino-2-deoxyglucuronate dehydrogenase